MKTIAIIQARMGSTRLPGKVLADLCGRPMLRTLLDRIDAVPDIDEVIVATTVAPEDDALATWLADQGVACYRGSKDDVLDRYYQCARMHEPDLVVRVTADDPLKDPAIIARAIAICAADPSIDYCSNTIHPTYPEGLDIEVVRFRALQRAHQEAVMPSDREHVMPYIWNRPDRFKLHSFEFERNLSHWRWTVDKPADLELMRAIFGHFGAQPLVPFTDVIKLIEQQPELLDINSGTIRNEGYFNSLAAEKK